MTFFEHIDALRPHLVRGVMAPESSDCASSAGFIIERCCSGHKARLPQQPHVDSGRPGAPWPRMVTGAQPSFDTDPETFRIANDRFTRSSTLRCPGKVQPLHEDLAPDGTGAGHALHAGSSALQRPALTPKEIQGTHLFVFWCRSVSSEGCCSLFSSWRRCRSTSSPTTRPASSSPTCSTSATT